MGRADACRLVGTPTEKSVAEVVGAFTHDGGDDSACWRSRVGGGGRGAGEGKSTQINPQETRDDNYMLKCY